MIHPNSTGQRRLKRDIVWCFDAATEAASHKARF
jgi:hypothetical protein